MPASTENVVLQMGSSETNWASHKTEYAISRGGQKMARRHTKLVSERLLPMHHSQDSARYLRRLRQRFTASMAAVRAAQ